MNILFLKSKLDISSVLLLWRQNSLRYTHMEAHPTIYTAWSNVFFILRAGHQIFILYLCLSQSLLLLEIINNSCSPAFPVWPFTHASTLPKWEKNIRSPKSVFFSEPMHALLSFACLEAQLYWKISFDDCKKVERHAYIYVIGCILSSEDLTNNIWMLWRHFLMVCLYFP